MTKLIIAGGLVLIAMVAAPLRSSAQWNKNWDQYYYELGEADRIMQRNVRESARAARKLTAEERRTRAEAAQEEEKIRKLQARLVESLRALGFSEWEGPANPFKTYWFHLDHQSKECGAKCSVRLVVENISWQNVYASKPKLVMHSQRGKEVIVASESTAEFMEKTRDGALIKEKAAKLEQESLAAYSR